MKFNEKIPDEVLRLDEAATAGPWAFRKTTGEIVGSGAPVAEVATDRDRALILYYRTAAPALAHEVQRLKADLDAEKRNGDELRALAERLQAERDAARAVLRSGAEDRPAFTTSLTIPAERVACCLCSALEGGSDYWCWIASKVAPPDPLAFRFDKERVYPHIDYPMNSGGALVLEDLESKDVNGKPVKYRLTREALAKGLAVMAEKYPRHFAALVGENDDAETGDVLLQCSVLGDIVYG